ncbi:universal stress protein [Blastopirellula sp. JC732]|uniref:Universal stress protein n=1 Tax=Blastopirellula sediminis TaxID=2894196 RepID=A0A9X1SFN7_9BACT|nr:universal stress protein [Blastopirellula sediminis]MCC9608695.1 universal stress protein [Blastopirellula sediminis]MCC9628528.1 universal stress protein [Blastopirellula sediminis]
MIQSAVELASNANARLRGVTIVDTRRFLEKASMESSGYAGVEATRLTLAKRRQMESRDELLRLCRSRAVRCDVRDERGDPLDLLADEAKYHDLTIASYAGKEGRHDAGLSAQDLIELAQRLVQPLLILRRRPARLDRVLLVYDGSGASSRAIRSFAAHSSFLGRQYRLICVGEAADSQSGAYREMTEYCHSRIASLETGRLPGSPLKTVTKYAQKWEADLLVLGIARSANWWGSPYGQLASDVLQQTEFPIYAFA